MKRRQGAQVHSAPWWRGRAGQAESCLSYRALPLSPHLVSNSGEGPSHTMAQDTGWQQGHTGGSAWRLLAVRWTLLQVYMNKVLGVLGWATEAEYGSHWQVHQSGASELPQQCCLTVEVHSGVPY